MKKFIISVLIVCAFAGIMSVSAWDEVFFDDFSSGTLEKWTAGDGFKCIDGKVGVNVFNRYLKPNGVEASEYVSVQYDITGYCNNFFVQFTDADDPKSFFRAVNNTVTAWDVAQLWDGTDSGWKILAERAGLDGGTAEEPKTTSVRYVLNNGELSLYMKKETDEDFIFKGSSQDEMIDPNAKYIPCFYVIGSSNAGEEGLCKIDNVSVKTLKEFKPILESETIEVRPNTRFYVDFDYNIVGNVTMNNINLLHEDGTQIPLILSRVTPKRYEIRLAASGWLQSGENVKLVLKDLENEFGQKIDETEVPVTAAVHDKDFTIGNIKFLNEDGTEIEKPTAEKINVSAELLPNIREAETADIVIMNCSGTPEKYRVCEIYYYNSVSAFSEKTAQFEIESGGFIKIMAPKSFDENILAADSLIIQDFNLN